MSPDFPIPPGDSEISPGRDESAGSSGDNAASDSAERPSKGAGSRSSKKSTGRHAPTASKARAGEQPNNVRKLRQAAMMSKAELARRAGISPLTVDRVESGCPCRMDTKRKILEALGLSPSARAEVWPDLDD